MIPQIPDEKPNSVPYAVAQKALEELPYAERRRLMRMHLNGFNSAPVVQNHLQKIAEDFEQKVLEFSARTLENMRRIAVVSSRLANDSQAINYFAGIKIQVETLIEGINALRNVEKNLVEAVKESKKTIELRNAKIKELTEILNAFNRTLANNNRRHSMNLNIVNALGDKISGHIVGAYVPPADSKHTGAIGPRF